MKAFGFIPVKLAAFVLLHTTTAFLLSPHSQTVPPPISKQSSFSLESTSALSNNEDLVAGIAAIDASNAELLGRLERLRDQPYFRYYSVDILASCEYMPQELFECYTESCEIYPEEDDSVGCIVCGFESPQFS